MNECLFHAWAHSTQTYISTDTYTQKKNKKTPPQILTYRQCVIWKYVMYLVSRESTLVLYKCFSLQSAAVFHRRTDFTNFFRNFLFIVFFLLFQLYPFVIFFYFGYCSGFTRPLNICISPLVMSYAFMLHRLMFRPSACQLSAVVPFRLLVLRSGTAYQTMSLPLRPCQPSGAIWRHTYSAAVTTLSDTARTYSVYSGPRGGVAA